MTNDRDDIAAIWLAEEQGSETPGGTDVSGLARCDAVIALTPRLAKHPDIAWAFDEARRLARAAPVAAKPQLPWFRRPSLAWTCAGLTATACLALAVVLMPGPTQSPQTPVAAGIPDPDFGPIRLPADVESRLAAVERVVMIDNVSIDGRSIAIVPATGLPGSSGIARADMETERVIERAMQVAAAMNLYIPVTPRDVAAAYAGTELTSEQIASQLGVRGLVTLNIDSDGQTVSVNIHATDAANAGAESERRLVAPINQLASIDDDITSSLLAALGAERPATGQPAP